MENHQKLGLFLQRSIKLPNGIKFSSDDGDIIIRDPYDKDGVVFYIYLTQDFELNQNILDDTWNERILNYGVRLSALEPAHEALKKVQEAANDFARKLNEIK